MPKNVISLDQAIHMTKMYRANREKVLAEPYQNKDVLPICETFDREAFDMMLSNPECKKVRVYLGMNDKYEIKAIVVGVNDKDEDILPSGQNRQASSEDDGDAVIIDDGFRCPVICPPPSALNED